MEVVEAARAAPSDSNSQPWCVYLVTGKAKDALGEAITRAYHANVMCVDEVGRRRYYSALSIDRSDVAARARQTERNCVFLDAPVGLIFATHAADET